MPFIQRTGINVRVNSIRYVRILVVSLFVSIPFASNCQAQVSLSDPVPKIGLENLYICLPDKKIITLGTLGGNFTNMLSICCKSLHRRFKIDIAIDIAIEFFLDFAAISLANSKKVAFAYKMDGIEKEWVHTDSRNSISYTNLEGGRFRFHSKASNPDGIWSKEVILKSIFIGSCWWDTPLFKLLGTCALIVLIYLFYEYRLQKAVEKEQLQTKYEKELAELKMNAFTAQMNPHFIFNSLNSIDYFIIKNEPEKASDYLNRFSRLIRMVLVHTRSTYISLKDDMEALKLYIELESLRFDNKFDYVVTASNNLDLESIQIPPMLFQPYIENAIWHGLMHKREKGRIELRLEINENGNLLTGIITDNGIGRTKAKELRSKSVQKKNGQAMGMKITRDKIDAINFLHDLKVLVEVEDLNGEIEGDTGTKVILKIPI